MRFTKCVRGSEAMRQAGVSCLRTRLRGCDILAPGGAAGGRSASRLLVGADHRHTRGFTKRPKAASANARRPVRPEPSRTDVRHRRLRLNRKPLSFGKWCPGAESNHRHDDFQSSALPLSYPGISVAAAHPARPFGRARLWLRALQLASPMEGLEVDPPQQDQQPEGDNGGDQQRAGAAELVREQEEHGPSSAAAAAVASRSVSIAALFVPRARGVGARVLLRLGRVLRTLVLGPLPAA